LGRRGVSSPLAMGMLLAANFVPIIGITVGGWNLHALVLVYWSETIVIGLMAIAKMTMSSKLGELGKSKSYQIVFFIAHYATFVVIYGVFISVALFADSDGPRGNGILAGVAIVTYIASHLVSFKWNYLDKGEFRKVSSLTQMVMPYARLLPSHFTLLVGVLFLSWTAFGAFGMILLAVLKVVMDVAAHLAEHVAVGRLKSEPGPK
jgi:hypothetical protein